MNATVTLSTGKLSLASWVIAYVSPAGVFKTHPVAAEGTRAARILTIEVQAKSRLLAVRMHLPLTAKPAVAMKGGLFDSRAVKMLDGLDWSNEPCKLERARTGLKVYAPAIGPRAVGIPEAKGVEYVSHFDALAAPTSEGAPVSLLTLRERLTAKGNEIPGALLSAFAVLDRLTPEEVTPREFQRALVLSGRAQAIHFDILLPLTQAVSAVMEGNA